MALKKKKSRRILLLSVILVLIGWIYYSISEGIIKIDPFLLRLVGVFFTFILSLLIVSVVIRLTASKVWNMFEKEMDLEQRIIISKLYSVSLYSIAFIITFWKAGVSLGNITIFVGLIATGFAFAVRDLLLSFFAWFIILNKRPFQMGDYIKIGDDFGLVTRIGTFFFTLELQNKPEYAKIPNSLILTKPALNKGSGHYREEIKIALSSIPENYSDKLNELNDFIKARIGQHEKIKTQLNANDHAWYISISFLTSFKQENLIPAILMEVQRVFGNNLKFGI